MWCRRHPQGVRQAFRDRGGWRAFLAVLQDVLEEGAEGSAPAPQLDTVEAATLYQTLYWVARTAAVPTPHTDLLHVTAAGWAAIPALVHKALHGTPMLLTEHGVYVRESYLAAARSRSSPGQRFISTRLARGLALAAYDGADMVSPVSDANARWAIGMGVSPEKVQVIYNGVGEPEQPTPPPRAGRVVAVGRVDPLKDVHTMLRVAVEVLQRRPATEFLYYGPVTPGQEAYGKTCEDLHRQLGLGDGFRFMGSTRNVTQVLQDSDMLLMTSISEGMPMGILEALSQAGRRVDGGRWSPGGPARLRARRSSGGRAWHCGWGDHAPGQPLSGGCARPARSSARRAQVHEFQLPGQLSHPDRGVVAANGGRMSQMTPERARAVVEARLGRPAQDQLEAAVVLEAWGGLRAADALERGPKVIRRAPAPVKAEQDHAEPESRGRSSAAEGISLMLAVLAVAAWAAPLSAHLGASAWDSAVRLALPITLALQWIVWSRHLRSGEGLGSLRHEGPVGVVALLVLEAVLFSFGTTGAIAGMLVAIWVGGTVLVDRGWVVWYALQLAVIGAILAIGGEPHLMLGIAALGTLAAVAAALITSTSPAQRPAPWGRALVAGAIGAGLGALLVADHTIGWGFRGAVPALALIPSTVGGFWGGRHLSRIHVNLASALRGIPASHADHVNLRGPGLATVGGAILRLAAGTALLSLACVLVAPAMSGTVATSLFVGFGCLALATLMVSMLVSLGRLAWALFVVATSVSLEILLLPHVWSPPGSGLIGGAAIAVLLSLPPIVKVLVRPGRALATAVWIP